MNTLPSHARDGMHTMPKAAIAAPAVAHKEVVLPEIVGLDAVRNLWQHKDLGIYKDQFTTSVPVHSVVMIVVKAK